VDIYKRLESYIQCYTVRIFTAFLRHSEQCLCNLLNKFALLTFRNINVFVKNAQNLNTREEKFVELGHTAGT
jgi:hypothetical protein